MPELNDGGTQAKPGTLCKEAKEQSNKQAATDQKARFTQQVNQILDSHGVFN
jgi:hypothetical protein